MLRCHAHVDVREPVERPDNGFGDEPIGAGMKQKAGAKRAAPH
jgi:hypothetical protein